jgi:hypothetical protein
VRKPWDGTEDRELSVVEERTIWAQRRLPRPTPERIHRVLLAAVLALGAAAQLRVWAFGQGFWTDELAIALNLRDLGGGQLFGPLLYRQVAPIGWLLGEDAVYAVLGADERALRLPSLLASLAVLGLTALLAHRIVGRWGDLVATALVATAPALLLYTGELKQYAAEAAVALLVITAADRIGREPTTERGRMVALVGWGVVGMLAVFVSFSAILVAAGAFAGIGAYLAIRRRWPELIGFAVASVPIAFVGGTLIYHRRSQPMLLNQDLVFPTGMPPRNSGPVEVWAWLPRMWNGVVDNPLFAQASGMVIGLLGLGLVALLAGQLRRGLMFAGVFAAAFGAAMTRQFPLAGRVAVYLVAPAFIVIAYGLTILVRATIATVRDPSQHGSRPKLVLIVALPLIVVGAAVAAIWPAQRAAVQEVATPLIRDQGREVLRDVARRLRPGDAVIFYRYSSQLGHFYGPVTGVPHRWEGQLGPARPGVGCDGGKLRVALKGARRVWWVHGAIIMAHPSEYNRWVAADLGRFGRVIDARIFAPDGAVSGVNTKRAGWVLVQLGKPANLTPPAPSDARFRCFSVQLPQP